MPVHSHFVIHWTGKKHLNQVKPATKADEVKAYVDLLRSILKQGLRMKKGQEKMYGLGGKGFCVEGPFVCFSEVKVSQVSAHRCEYGSLGIGVDRQFVMARLGGPVFYVPGGSRGAVIANLANIHDFISKAQDQRDQDLYHKVLDIVMAFCKELPQEDAELRVYEEMEWRIVWLDTMKAEHWRKEGEDFYLPLKGPDVRIVIFPDEDVREAALADNGIAQALKHGPIMMLADDCEHF